MGSPSERDVEGGGSRGKAGDMSENPLLFQLVVIKMEDIMDRLKLLQYETVFCKKFKFQPFSRYPFTWGA